MDIGEELTLWYHPQFDRIGILNMHPQKVVSVMLFCLATQYYEILTKPSWLYDDGWEYLGIM